MSEERGNVDSCAKYFEYLDKERWLSLTPGQRAFFSSFVATRPFGLYAVRCGEATAWLDSNGEAISLTDIRTDSRCWGRGHARGLLRHLCETADATGVTIELRAIPKGFETNLSGTQLASWFRRHGFTGQGEDLQRLPVAAPGKVVKRSAKLDSSL